ncbi:hypothetical protein NPIL_365951 [Nephila pilipes]|uniref:Uncharacterized protein n=1 Tax=Nephila pilipes TaxID=299642 RepID=A0A8X6Q3M9_NEPPI|nr:hypothetical protein NPIL_365951 [Nephila pilipes]
MMVRAPNGHICPLFTPFLRCVRVNPGRGGEVMIVCPPLPSRIQPAFIIITDGENEGPRWMVALEIFYGLVSCGKIICSNLPCLSVKTTFCGRNGRHFPPLGGYVTTRPLAKPWREKKELS